MSLSNRRGSTAEALFEFSQNAGNCVY